MFEQLYDRYSGKIFGRCISLLRNEVAAMDATQEVFVKILLNLSKYNGRSSFSTWVYSITYNYCIDHIRREKRKGLVFSDRDIEGLDQEDEVEDNFILEDLTGILKHIEGSTMGHDSEEDFEGLFEDLQSLIRQDVG